MWYHCAWRIYSMNFTSHFHFREQAKHKAHLEQYHSWRRSSCSTTHTPLTAWTCGRMGAFLEGGCFESTRSSLGTALLTSYIPLQKWAFRLWHCMLSLYNNDGIYFIVSWQILGTGDLVEYVHKYDLYFNTSSITRHIVRTLWKMRINTTDPINVDYAPPDAVDLLRRLLV